MIIWGTVIAIVGAAVLMMFLGPYGISVLLAVAFGMLLSIYLQTKDIHAEVRIIKEKLGITDEVEPDMTNEEIEAELESQLSRPQEKREE